MEIMLSWDSFLDSMNERGLSDRALFLIGGIGTHVVTFWGMNLVFFLLYRYNLFPKQRIQGGVMPSESLIRSCVINRLRNHFISQPIALWFAYPLFMWCGISLRGPIPPVSIWIRDFIVALVLNDALFYWAHRGLHHKSIYKYIHKQHHMFNHTIGIASEYAHPVEDVIANIIPTLAGPLVMGSHAVVMWSWLCLRLMETIDSHSGYHFEWSPFNNSFLFGGARRHDFHHSHNQGCYGAYVWDRLMGTDLEYIAYEEKLQKEAQKSK